VSNLQLVPSPPLAPATAGMTLPRVLLGVDFGSASLAAARWATTYIAPRANALLSHVWSFPDDGDDDREVDPARAESLRRMRPAVAGGLRGFAATLGVERARSILRMGRPSHWLSVIANDEAVSLAVFGRRADANRVRIGEPNVIERASRRTNASVLVVPEGVVDPPTHVVAAVDESRFAPRVVRAARHVARLHDIPMTILHVLSPAVGAYERVIRTARHLLGAERKLKSTRVPATNVLPLRLAPWLVELGQSHDANSRDRTEVAMGDPAREITAFARSNNATLIVVGKRGFDDAPVGSIGSVARELLTRAPVAVLAVSRHAASSDA